jgi:hypothetical protein
MLRFPTTTLRAARGLTALAYRSQTTVSRAAIVRYASSATAASTSNDKPKSGLAPLAARAAEEVSSKWKGTTANGGRTKNYIGGEFVESKAERWLEVRDPVS